MQITLGDALGLELNNIRKSTLISAKERTCFDLIIWVITCPIIVMPDYTDVSLPSNVLERIRIERLIIAATQEKITFDVLYISLGCFCANILALSLF